MQLSLYQPLLCVRAAWHLSPDPVSNLPIHNQTWYNNIYTILISIKVIHHTVIQGRVIIIPASSQTNPLPCHCPPCHPPPCLSIRPAISMPCDSLILKYLYCLLTIPSPSPSWSLSLHPASQPLPARALVGKGISLKSLLYHHHPPPKTLYWSSAGQLITWLAH